MLSSLIWTLQVLAGIKQILHALRKLKTDPVVRNDGVHDIASRSLPEDFRVFLQGSV